LPGVGRINDGRRGYFILPRAPCGSMAKTDAVPRRNARRRHTGKQAAVEPHTLPATAGRILKRSRLALKKLLERHAVEAWRHRALGIGDARCFGDRGFRNDRT
jgi:hypothetical protein